MKTRIIMAAILIIGISYLLIKKIYEKKLKNRRRKRGIHRVR